MPRSRLARAATVVAGAVAAAMLGVAVLGAVGSDDRVDLAAGAGPVRMPDPPAAEDHCYIDAMLPHHEQALELSELVLAAGAGERVAKLAEFIRTDQGREIAQMEAWRDAWADALDAPAPAPAAAGHTHHGAAVPAAAPAPTATACDRDVHATMHGMATPAQLDELAALHGAAAERRFLELMIAHHEGALEMAETAVREGTNAYVRSSAKHVLLEQEREIAAMRGMLADAR